MEEQLQTEQPKLVTEEGQLNLKGEAIEFTKSIDWQEYAVKKALDQGLGIGTGIVITLVAGYFGVKFVFNNLGLREGLNKITDLWEAQTNNLTKLSDNVSTSLEGLKENTEEIQSVKVLADKIHEGLATVSNDVRKIEADIEIANNTLENISNKLTKRW